MGEEGQRSGGELEHSLFDSYARPRLTRRVGMRRKTKVYLVFELTKVHLPDKLRTEINRHATKTKKQSEKRSFSEEVIGRYTMQCINSGE
jgi:hypothetical protein